MWRNAAIVLVAAPSAVQAAQLATFNVQAGPVGEAVERFAVQGRVSAAQSPLRPCVGRSHDINGLMTPAEALARLLPAGCGFQAPLPRTFRITGPQPPGPIPTAPSAAGLAAAVAEVVVTAEKRVEPLAGRPFAVSVLSGQEVARLGGRTFADIAAQIPGVTVTNLGSGRNKIFIRGLSDGSFTGRTRSTVGLYLDDVPITYDAPDPDLRLSDISQVEVLRGPQGSLYGSGSISGIVKIVTNRPDPKAYAANLELDGARTLHGSESGGYEAMVNLPLLGGRGAVRGVIYEDKIGGYIDLPRRGLINQNNSRRNGGRLALAALLPDAWRIDAKYVRQTIRTADAQYTQGVLGPLTRDTRIREPHNNVFGEYSLTSTHAGDVANLSLSAAFIDHNATSRFDATGSFSPYGVSTAGAGFDDTRRLKLFVTEAVLTSAAPGPTRWLAGLFASSADETNSGILLQARVAPLSVYRRRDKLTEVAAYAEVNREIGPRLALTVGGRLFGTRLSTFGDHFDLTPDLHDVAAGRLRNAGFAPKARLAYTFSSGLVTYAQLQEGYRPGGFDVPAVPGPPGGAGAQRYRPDRLWNSEVGADLSLLDKRLVIRTALFHSAWKDLQTDQYLPSGLPMTVNVGDGVNTGLEASILWKPDEHLQARATFLVENPQLARAADVFPTSRNVGLPGVPSHMGSADISYGWTPWSGWRAEISGQAFYIGQSFLTFERGAINAMGGYGIGRVEASLMSRRWRLNAYVDNVTDSSANTFAFGNPFSREVGSQATPPRPRTVGLALGWGF